MYTVTDIVNDVNRSCMINNMVEDKFSYRFVYFVNDGNKGAKYYADCEYGNLRKALENIIRKNLSLTNSIVIAEATVLKDGKCIRLLSRSYLFSLDEYFKRINGERSDNRYRHAVYGKCVVR